ncbi:hypothetical protein SAMN05444172_9066 [Burkholderia sp. GAS332]|nr:hypothetical protein SAMN05444172_9066 [Burkholderia sp. GAS332]
MTERLVSNYYNAKSMDTDWRRPTQVRYGMTPNQGRANTRSNPNEARIDATSIKVISVRE